MCDTFLGLIKQMLRYNDCVFGNFLQNKLDETKHGNISAEILIKKVISFGCISSPRCVTLHLLCVEFIKRFHLVGYKTIISWFSQALPCINR